MHRNNNDNYYEIYLTVKILGSFGKRLLIGSK